MGPGRVATFAAVVSGHRDTSGTATQSAAGTCGRPERADSLSALRAEDHPAGIADRHRRHSPRDRIAMAPDAGRGIGRIELVAAPAALNPGHTTRVRSNNRLQTWSPNRSLSVRRLDPPSLVLTNGGFGYRRRQTGLPRLSAGPSVPANDEKPFSSDYDPPLGYQAGAGRVAFGLRSAPRPAGCCGSGWP
jgi:hypothetical protein